jgi:hypothetical protein
MNTLIFTALIKNATWDSGMQLDTVSFSGETPHYSVEFFGTKENNYDLEIANFGCGEQGNFTPVEPTTKQRELMQKMILQKSNEIQKFIEEEEREITYKEFCEDRYNRG